MKLIVSDLDGTLLNDKGIISEGNIEAIKRATRDGIKFAIATGRSYDSANKVLEKAGLSAPIIGLNGAAIYNDHHELIHEVTLDHETCRKIISICDEENMYMECFTNKGIFSTSREYFKQVIVDIMRSSNPNIPDEEIDARVNLRFQEEQVQFIEKSEDIFLMDDIEVYKFLCFAIEEEKLSEAKDRLSQLDIEITSSGSINLELNHSDAQKGIAVEILAKKMGFGLEEVMALGDNLNDKSMLEKVGRGVAMGNSHPDIKALCHYRTRNDDEDGVAHAIDEMLKEAFVK